MKKSSLISVFASAVLTLSYFNINQNMISCNISADIYSGNYIQIQPGGFTAVQWDSNYKYSHVVCMDDSQIKITTIFCKDLCYTYINAETSDLDSEIELRAYINDNEYISLIVHVTSEYDPSNTNVTTTKATSASAPQTTKCSTTAAATECTTTICTTCTTAKYSTVVTTKPGEVSSTAEQTEITTKKATTTSYVYDHPITVTSSTSYTSISPSGDIATTYDGSGGQPDGDDTTKENDFHYGTVMSANEYGDVNSDGNVDISDLTTLSLALLGDVTLTPAERIAADVIPSPYSIPDLADLATLKQFLMKDDDVTLGPQFIVYR